MRKLNQISKELKSRGKTIIYDATQALFVDFFEYDYAFVSLRKWFYSFDLKQSHFLECDQNKGEYE